MYGTNLRRILCLGYRNKIIKTVKYLPPIAVMYGINLPVVYVQDTRMKSDVKKKRFLFEFNVILKTPITHTLQPVSDLVATVPSGNRGEVAGQS